MSFNVPTGMPAMVTRERGARPVASLMNAWTTYPLPEPVSFDTVLTTMATIPADAMTNSPTLAACVNFAIRLARGGYQLFPIARRHSRPKPQASLPGYFSS